MRTVGSIGSRSHDIRLPACDRVLLDRAIARERAGFVSVGNRSKAVEIDRASRAC